MITAKTILSAAAVAAAFVAPALAQDAEFRLPEQCTTTAAPGGMEKPAMGHDGMHGDQDGRMGAGMMDMMGTEGMEGVEGMEGMDLGSMPEHVQENMRKMMMTMPAMQEGMMQEDADVAFACAMIAHHQGAIDMAEVLLEHGDDPQMRALAEKIIAAQVGEVEQMTRWLSENTR